MNRKHLKIRLLAATFLFTVFTGCRKTDAKLPDNYVQFSIAEQGFAATEQEAEIEIVLTRAVNSSVPIKVNIASEGIEYGTGFKTIPEAVGNQIQINTTSGSNLVTIKLIKEDDLVLYGGEKIEFTLVNAGDPLLIGQNTTLSLLFDEIISAGTAITLNGGGATYPNKVFLDLSANKQTAVERTKWDLGFYSGNEWRVILNSSTGMMAKAIDKNDLNDVSAADTVGLGSDVIFNQSAPQPSSLAYIDYPDGDLTKTAIAEISADAAANKVYIVNRGTGIGSPATDRGWKKIRIIRNSSGGYTLQHADISATTFTSVDIPKDQNYFFNYASFETGKLSVEPEATKWDIAWTYFSNVTNFGSEVPYLFQDVVLQNRNVEVAQVLEATKTYADFTANDINGLQFSKNQTSIGSGWRSGGGPGSAPQVRTDRFYVLKDGAGNVYKLKFTALTQDNERGYPAVEYALVKEGN